jgi:hypothetical protein
MASHQGRNPVHHVINFTINILLANDVVEFPVTAGVFNLRDVARSCEVWEDVVTGMSPSHPGRGFSVTRLLLLWSMVVPSWPG